MTQRFAEDADALASPNASAAAAAAAAVACAAVTSTDAASVVPVVPGVAVDNMPEEDRFVPTTTAVQSLEPASESNRVVKVAAALTVEEAMAVAEHEQQPEEDAQVLPEHTQLETHVDTLPPAIETPDPNTHMDMMPPVQPLVPGQAQSQTPTPAKKKRKTYSTEEERRKARILKNRRTAEESRQRRMKRMKELEEFVASSAIREKELQEDARVAKVQLINETESLRQVISQKDAEIEQKDAEIQRLREKLAAKLAPK